MENVGLVTGEERVNERAPVLCSTVAMAPVASTTTAGMRFATPMNPATKRLPGRL